MGPRVRGLLANTLLLVAGTLAVSLPVGTLLAILVTKTNMPERRWLERLVVAMLFVPLYVQAVAWQAALGLGGWLPYLVQGGGHPMGTWLEGWRGAIWVHSMAAMPWIAVFVAAALRTVPRELEEDALLSASPGRVIWRVTLRQAPAGMLAAALWTGVLCASEMTVTDLFQVRSFAEEVYTAASLGELDATIDTPLQTGEGDGWRAVAVRPPMQATDLWLGTSAIAILVFAAMLATRHFFSADSIVSLSTGWRWRMGRSRWVAAGVGWLLAAILVGVPLASMAWKAGTRVDRAGDQFVRTWSATKLVGQVVQSPFEHRREWGWSLAIGGTAAAAATLVGTLLAWALRTRRLPLLPVAAFLAIGFAVPGPVVGVWLIRWMNQPPDSALGFLTWFYDYTILAPAVAQTLRALPLTTFLLWTQMTSVPQDMLDSAASEGASSLGQLCRVVLPLRWPGLLAAACVALVVAIGELAATVLVVPPGVSTLSVRIFGLLHYGAEDRVAALCLAIWLLACVLTAVCQAVIAMPEKLEES